MLVQGRTCRTIWTDPHDPRAVKVLDQRRLPFEIVEHPLRTLDDAVDAIHAMIVRGAPLIGVTAAYGLYLALLARSPDEPVVRLLHEAGAALRRARPTAVNLAWAVDRVTREVLTSPDAPEDAALAAARRIEVEDVEHCRLIGEHGVEILSAISARKAGAPVNVLTHCNAGWLACVDWGTATSPIYAAHQRGIPLHVWIDETRPRNQGARLTAWELAQQGIPHTLIVDNAGGHLMQHGMVDVVIVGSDRTTATGDVCNKIGTYLKALAARDNGIPFYAALPSSTIDWSIRDGVREIPIEERGGREVRLVEGEIDGEPAVVRVVPEGTPVSNFGFDVTPARLVTGIITEHGVCEATEEGLLTLYPERRRPLGEER
jgi:methylthioribose-1-phosphate isomerase